MYKITAYFIIWVCLLAACQPILHTNTTAVTDESAFLDAPTLIVSSTRQVFFPKTSLPTTPIHSPNDTATLTPTLPPTATLLPGMRLVEHPESANVPFVFEYSPDKWKYSLYIPWENGPQLLRFNHIQISDCYVETVAAGGIPEPNRLYDLWLASNRWVVYEYDRSNMLYQHGTLFLMLVGRADAQCYKAQEAFLAGVLPIEEYYGYPILQPTTTATPRPALADFDCSSSLPPRLRVGDVAHVIANSVWLRSKPLRSVDTQTKLFLQYAPVLFSIEAGPICQDKYVFWQVQASRLGEGGETYPGWIAESDDQEYFLEVWLP